LTANGVGEYGVSVEVNETKNPKIKSAFSEVLRVSIDDFDSLTVAVDVDSIVSGVWNAQTGSFNVSGSYGDALSGTDAEALNLKLCELHQIMGLEIGKPMTVTTTERVVGAITQSLSGDASTSITVTRTS